MIWGTFCILVAHSLCFFHLCNVRGFMQRRMNKIGDAALGCQKHEQSAGQRSDIFNNGTVRDKIVVILGPTATGKTDASIEVALRLKEYNIAAEIINADSMQVYEGFHVGTAKPTLQQMETIKHHLFGFVPPTEYYNASEYVHKASALIANMHENNILPILVGGTNLYIEGLIWPSVMDMPQEEKESNEAYEEHTTSELYEQLMKLDPERAAAIHRNDRNRITRSLDVIRRCGVKHSQLIMQSRKEKTNTGPKYEVLIFAMLCEPTEHKERIRKRTQKMMENGILEECHQLVKLIETQNVDTRRGICQSIAYKELIPILKALKGDEATPEESIKEQCAAKLETATWQYARRQNTWIRNRFEKERLLKMVLIDTTDVSYWNTAIIGGMVDEILHWHDSSNES